MVGIDYLIFRTKGYNVLSVANESDILYQKEVPCKLIGHIMGKFLVWRYRKDLDK